MSKLPRLTCDDRQKMYIKNYVECRGVKAEAGRRSGVPEQTYLSWFRLDYFQDEVDRRISQVMERVRAKGLQLALEGNEKMIKLYEEAFAPELFDKEIRRIKYLNDNKLQESASINVKLVPGNTPDKERNIISTDIVIEALPKE